ncbi:hypothetical protein FLL45_16890 [Aliikangiella marina]|uniref:GAF domain-containing protein n=1 Tax=Aliikangiella marina TaxID=1712262 RepID=A0A545T7F7_9GAMM|nr:hypothetical protein [Aliikangiella marina]TQV73128.1 hypothetical protein FLL45_16890 [Aliikangiella marina]
MSPTSINFSTGKLQAPTLPPNSDLVTYWINQANNWLNENIDYTQAITAASALAAGTRWAIISKRLGHDSSRVKMLALFDQGEFKDCQIYDFIGTPCEEVLSKDKFCLFSNVQKAFPDDPDLVEMGVMDYAGCALRDKNNKSVGHLFVMHDQPINNFDEVEEIILAMIAILKLEWDFD